MKSTRELKRSSGVRRIGESDSKVKYRLFVSQNERKLLWEGPIRSCRHSSSRISQSDDCLIIKKNLALYFSDNDCRGKEDLTSLNLLIQGEIVVD